MKKKKPTRYYKKEDKVNKKINKNKRENKEKKK